MREWHLLSDCRFFFESTDEAVHHAWRDEIAEEEGVCEDTLGDDDKGPEENTRVAKGHECHEMHYEDTRESPE